MRTMVLAWTRVLTLMVLQQRENMWTESEGKDFKFCECHSQRKKTAFIIHMSMCTTDLEVKQIWDFQKLCNVKKL